MDRYDDNRWERLEADTEAGNEAACRAAAKAARHTDTDADECNSGELRCPTCPWKKGYTWDTHTTGTGR